MNWIGERLSAPPPANRPPLSGDEIDAHAKRVAWAVKATGQPVPTGGVWRFVLEAHMRWPDAQRVFARCAAHGVEERTVDGFKALVAVEEKREMVFNFEVEHDDILYDVDAETKMVGHDKLEVVLLEVRRVHDDDDNFTMVPLDQVTGELRETLAAAANDDVMRRAEPDPPPVFDDR